MLGRPVRASLMLVLALASLTTAQESAASRSGGGGPIVDPALVGTWTGSLHLTVRVRFEIGAVGQFTVSMDGGPSAYLLEAADGQWQAEPIQPGKTLTGTYRLLRSGRLEWRGGWMISALERSGNDATTSRPTVAASELHQLDNIPRLLASLEAPDAAHRSIAALRLARLVSRRLDGAAATIPSLIEHLRDSSPEVRWHCVVGVRAAGAAAGAAGARLLELLRDDDARVRHGAVMAFRPVVGDPTLVVSALATALADSDYAISDAAGFELREIAAHAAPAAEALAKALTAYPHRVNDGAKFALMKLDEAAASVAGPVIAKAFKEGLLRVWMDEDLLKWAGPFAKEAVPSLIEVVESASLQQRGSAVRILRAIGPEARRAIPVLKDVVENEKERRWLRDAAQDAIDQIATGSGSRASRPKPSSQPADKGRPR